jgi:hypothetical protein
MGCGKVIDNKGFVKNKLFQNVGSWASELFQTVCF